MKTQKYDTVAVPLFFFAYTCNKDSWKCPHPNRGQLFWQKWVGVKVLSNQEHLPDLTVSAIGLPVSQSTGSSIARGERDVAR